MEQVDQNCQLALCLLHAVPLSELSFGVTIDARVTSYSLRAGVADSRIRGSWLGPECDRNDRNDFPGFTSRIIKDHLRIIIAHTCMSVVPLEQSQGVPGVPCRNMLGRLNRLRFRLGNKKPYWYLKKKNYNHRLESTKAGLCGGVRKERREAKVV